ncbi:MAG: VWA domain-containing protein [Planctomycetia bacterium]|nr:VWA domain-containing protein [Planctomycetia bacterium]
MNSIRHLVVRLALLAALAGPAPSALCADGPEEKTVEKAYDAAVDLLQNDKFPEARKALDELETLAKKVRQGDPEYKLAQDALKEIPRLREISFHNSAVAADRRGDEALQSADLDEVVSARRQMAADLAELAKLKPNDRSAKTNSENARRQLAQSQLLLQLSRGQKADELLKAAELPAAKPLHEVAPDFLLPRADVPGVVSLRDLPGKAVVIQLFQGGHATAPMATKLLALLEKQFGAKGVGVMAVAMDDGDGLERLDEFLTKNAPAWPVALSDQSGFAQQYVRGAYYLPSYIVVAPDRRALWIADQDPLAGTAAVFKVLLDELAAPAGDVPGGPAAWFPRAEPFAGLRIGGDGRPQQVRLAGKPTLLVVTTASEGRELRDELSRMAPGLLGKIELAAAVYVDDRTTAAAWAEGWKFPAWRLREELPETFGPNYVPRVALISAQGRVLHWFVPPRDDALRARVLSQYAAALARPGSYPAAADEPPRFNLAARSAGGAVKSSAKAASDAAAEMLIDGVVNREAWRPDGKPPHELRLSFLDGKPATFDRIVLDARCNVQAIEVLAGDRAEGPFRSLGVFRRQDREAAQAFAVPQTTAAFVNVRVPSVKDEKRSPRLELREIAVEEAAGARPSLAERLAARAAPAGGMNVRFDRDGIPFWQQLDFGLTKAPAAWSIRQQRLVADDAPHGLDFRSSALLSPHAAVGDFHLRLAARTSNTASGIVFGFQDWENFDRLLLVKGGTDASHGNSIRLERWRGGRMEVLAVHGEPFPLAADMTLEVVRMGADVGVKAQGKWLFRAASPDAKAGRVGLCVAGDGEFRVAQFELSPQAPAELKLPEAEPLSSAAGASIAWLSDQSRPEEPEGWASNLLRPAVLAPAGHWTARRVGGEPPEIVLAFRDGREVLVSKVGFDLPKLAAGEAKDLVRKVEVLASREEVLRPESFRSLGTIDLAVGEETQWLTLAGPAPCRYLSLRLLDNRGGEQFVLGRVYARLAEGEAPQESAQERSAVEESFREPAAAKEQEPNDDRQRATTLPADRWVSGDVRTGQVDWFKLPPAPKRGKPTLHVRLQALPWLRLKAVLADESGKELPPPLADSSTGQTAQQQRTISAARGVPAYVRVEMPATRFGLVIDTSLSMGGREADLRAAVDAYLHGAEETEAIDVLHFGTDVEPIGSLPQNRGDVLEAVGRLSVRGNTALYQALLEGMRDKQAVVLLSDGMNTVFKAGFPDLCREVRRRPVPLFAIGVGRDLYEFDANSGNTAIGLLTNLARSSGGRFYFAPESDELAGLYGRIADEVRRNTEYRLHVHWEGVEAAPAELAAAVSRPAPRMAAGLLPPAEAELSPATRGRPVALKRLDLPSGLLELQPAMRHLAPRPFAIAGISADTAAELAQVPRRAVTRTMASAALPGEAELAPIPAAPAARLPLRGPAWGTLQVTHRPSDEKAPPLPKALLPAYLLVLDSSGSMAEQMDGRTKMNVAQDVAKQLVKSLPDGAQVGLRLYGHWGIWLARKTDPQAAALKTDDPRLDKDSELVAPLGLLTKEKRADLAKWIDWAEPRGKTPMVYSLLEGKKDFKGDWHGPKTIVLVSDGMETCGGKLADVEAAYKNSELGVVVHVVGFDIKESEAEQQLKAIAAAGGGGYFPAKDARQLAEALRKAVASTSYVVFEEDGKTVLERGLVNGPALELPPGRYFAAMPFAGARPVAIEIAESGAAVLRLTEETQLVPDENVPEEKQ